MRRQLWQLSCFSSLFQRSHSFGPVMWIKVLYAVQISDTHSSYKWILAFNIILFEFVSPENGVHKPSPALLEWKYVQDNLPWGIVLLLGEKFLFFFFFQWSNLCLKEVASLYLTRLRFLDCPNGLWINWVD
jgi:hypothetical protein